MAEAMDTLFLPISARKGGGLLLLQDYLADKETIPTASKKDKVQSLSSGLYLFYPLMK